MSRTTMDRSDVERRILALLAGIEGQVVDRWSVVDALLDLRQAAGADLVAVQRIDELLRALPGRHLVAADWWRTALEGLLHGVDA